MINSILFEIVEAYFNNNNPGGQIWAYSTFYAVSFIKEDLLKKVRLEYADYNQEKEKPILLIMDALKKSTQGILFTNTNVYYRLRSSYSQKNTTIAKIPVESINYFIIQHKVIGSVLMLNGKKVAYITVPSEEEVSIINGIINLMVTALQPIDNILPNINDDQKIILKINKLQVLHNYGAITDKELKEKKHELLSRL